MFFHKNNKIKSKKSGFTLIELMIVLVIFVALTGIMIGSQSKLDGSILLDNLAYDIALSVREAQTYGVNVKEFFTSPTTSVFTGYGVRFSRSDNKQYILFADVNPNYFFDGETTCFKDDSECMRKYTLTRGSFIADLCAGSDELNCDPQDEINITFLRPNPDAHITKGIAGNTVPNQSFSKITISSADGQTQNIIVTALGDIYVKK
ncbi:MAG: prepilin-type N-terminal cleavage/methylation domain-containing protein [Minisyncoccia bacterium]